MGLTNRIEIIDRDGWHKEVTLEKSIVYIGSAPHNDLYLDPQRGGGISSTHAQMIFSNESAGCQLVNLATTEILIGGETRLAAEESADLGAETMIQLGDFTLLFHGSFDSPAGGSQNAGRNLSLSVFLPANRLEAGRTITGTARLRNLGSESGVQVDLDIEGLDPGCYSIEPGPVLAAGAERDIHFRIHHRGSKPASGRCQFAIRAAARRAYSGEEIVSIQAIQVAPVYDYRLQIIPPSGTTAAPTAPSPLQLQEEPKVQPPPVMTPKLPPPVDSTWSDRPQAEFKMVQETPAKRVTVARPKQAPPASEGLRPVRLGISGLTVTPEISREMNLPEQQTGILVIDVSPGSLAALAGLRGGDREVSVLGQSLTLGGDIITGINGQPVQRIEDQAAILAGESGAALQSGKGLQVSVLRAGAPLELSTVPGVPLPETAAQEATSLQVLAQEEEAAEEAIPAEAPAEQAPEEAFPEPGMTQPEISEQEEAGLPATLLEPVSIQEVPAQEARPVVKMTNKEKPSAQRVSQARPKPAKPAARAVTHQAEAALQPAVKKTQEAPKPQAAATTEDSWWSPAGSADSQDSKPSVIQIKARAPSPSGKTQAGATGADQEAKKQDWWTTDEENEDET